MLVVTRPLIPWTGALGCLLYFRLLTALAEVQGELEEEDTSHGRCVKPMIFHLTQEFICTYQLKRRLVMSSHLADEAKSNQKRIVSCTWTDVRLFGELDTLVTSFNYRYKHARVSTKKTGLKEFRCNFHVKTQIFSEVTNLPGKSDNQVVKSWTYNLYSNWQVSETIHSSTSASYPTCQASTI